MRALGMPFASTVATVMAVGSRGSAALASFSQAANSRKGSSAAVKSPLVNQVGCSIEAVSDILWSARVTRGPTRQCRRCLYNGSPGPRLWRAGAVVGLLAVALASGGCSMSYQLNSLGSMFGGGDKSDITGSITPPAGAKSTSKLPPDDDLAYAKAAVSRLLALGSKYASLPWENPSTGARGTITPITSAYSTGGQTCRDFLASYVKGTSESWLQGEACKHHTGPWLVRSMKPWKSS